MPQQRFCFKLTYKDEQGRLQHTDIVTTDSKFRRRLDSPEAMAIFQRQFDEMNLTFLELQTIESISVDTMICTDEHMAEGEERRRGERRRSNLRLVGTFR